MIDSQKVLIALLGYIALREVYFFYSTQKLINKLMSRSFYEYRTAETVGKRPDRFQAPKIDDDPAEDLGPLQEVGL